MNWRIAWLLSVGVVVAGSARADAQQAAQTDPAAVASSTNGSWQARFEAALATGVLTMTVDQAAILASDSAPTVERARAVRDQARARADRAEVSLVPRSTLTARYTRLSPVRARGLLPRPANYYGDLAASDPSPDRPSVFDEAVSSAFDSLARSAFPQLRNQVVVRAELTFPATDLFLNLLPSYYIAREAQRIEDLRTDIEQRSIALQAREAYYDYVRARAAVVLAEGSLERARVQQDETAVLVSSGVMLQVERDRAVAGVSSARASLANAKGRLAIARASLARLVHRDLSGEIAVLENLTQATPIDEPLEQLMARATANRPELQAIDRFIALRERSETISRNRVLPRLDLVAGFDVESPAPRTSPQTSSFGTSWDLGAVLSWSPDQALQSLQQQNEAIAQTREARADRQALEEAIGFEVVRAYEAHGAADEAVAAALVGIDAAEAAYRVRVAQLKAQAAVPSQVIDAELELSRALDQLLDAAIQSRIARVQLRYAVGAL